MYKTTSKKASKLIFQENFNVSYLLFTHLKLNSRILVKNACFNVFNVDWVLTFKAKYLISKSNNIKKVFDCVKSLF